MWVCQDFPGRMALPGSVRLGRAVRSISANKQCMDVRCVTSSYRDETLNTLDEHLEGQQKRHLCFLKSLNVFGLTYLMLREVT